MSEPLEDPERIAALLDDRLDPRQRAQLLEQLASSDEGIEAFAEAAALVREMEHGDAGEDVVELRRGARSSPWRAMSGRWLMAAAVVLGLGVAVSSLVWRRVHAPPAVDSARFVALLAEQNAGLPAGWNGRPWATSRAAGDALTPGARATRIGARLVELELAVHARDSSTASIAAQLAALLEPIPASGAVIAIYEEIGRRAGSEPAELESLLERGRDAAAALAGADQVNLGRWVEAGRVAAAWHDAQFFGAATSRTALDRAVRLGTLSEDARRALEAIQAALSTGGEPDWEILERRLTELLGALGS